MPVIWILLVTMKQQGVPATEHERCCIAGGIVEEYMEGGSLFDCINPLDAIHLELYIVQVRRLPPPRSSQRFREKGRSFHA